MSSHSKTPSPFDDTPLDAPEGAAAPGAPSMQPGPGQFSLAAIALVTFDVAFILGWWANSNSYTPFGQLTNDYTNSVLGSTLRVGVLFFPIWTGVVAFFPALLGAALGACAHADVAHRRRVRGASLFWTLLSAMVIEWLVQWGLLIANFDSDARLLFFAFGNLGWSGLALIVYLAWLVMISAGYGLVVSLALALLGRWKMIPLSSPWEDAPWDAMWNLAIYGPYVWMVGFFIWELAGQPRLLAE